MNTSSPLRIGVLGCSYIAERSVIPAIQQTAGLTLAAVASRQPERTRTIAEKFSVPALTYDELVASPDIDAVYISMPNTLHASWALGALQAGKHVLVEKPFTDRLETATHIIETARARGLIAMEGLMYLFHPAIRQVHAMVKDGAIGALRSVEAAFGFPYLPEGNNRNNPELGGGAILDNLIYPLSFCLDLNAAPWSDLTYRIVPHERYPVDARGFMRIDWPSFSGHVSYGFGLAYRNEITLWGEQGTIHLNRAFTPPPTHEQTILLTNARGRQEITIPPADHFAIMLADFVAKVRGTPHSGRNTGDDILRRMRVIDTMRTAARHRVSPDLSVVIPVYKSAGVIEKTVRELSASLTETCPSFEIVLVNDASPDNSREVIESLARSDARIRPLHLMRNFGQHNAIMAGLRHAHGKTIVMMDDDGQHDPACIAPLLDSLRTGNDVAYVEYTKKVYGPFKNFGSWLNDRMANHLLEKPADLYLCSFKAITRELRDHILGYTGPAPYIDGIIVTATRRIGRVAGTHRGTLKDTSAYSLRKLVLHWLNMFTNFSIKPLRMIFALGVLTGLISLIGFLVVLAWRLTATDPPPGWSTIAVLVLFFGAVQLLSLGLIGEYIGRVLLHINSRPQYIVREEKHLPPSP